MKTAALAGVAIALFVAACGGSDGSQDELSTPIDDASAVSTEQPGERTLVEGECITDAVVIVACSSDAAKHQVKKVFDLDYLGISFPGDVVVQSQAAQGCGISVTNFFVPIAEEWASGLNIVICLGRVTR